ncbi:centrosomal protein CEP41 [Marchantia polymorpha subsp. ruderalis]
MQSTRYPRQGHVSARPLKDIKLINKYENVKSTIDSGLNMLKVTDKFASTKVNARFKKEEFFRRLKPVLLVKLLHETQIQILLLDVRDADEFQTCHIRGALSYPAINLKKTINYFSGDILPFINKEPEKIIVIYDDDEQSVVSAGNLFIEKGVDNIFVLHGGLEEVANNYPEMIEGHYKKQEILVALKERNGMRSSIGSKSSSPNWIQKNKMFTNMSTRIGRSRRSSSTGQGSLPATPGSVISRLSRLFSPCKG